MLKNRRIPNFITSLWTSEDERSEKAKRNILALLVRKGLGIGISFLLVPATLHYLGAARYGVWLTISSVLTWLYFFDIGLGNGMRNRVAEALARGERNLVQTYVSTTYAMIAIIVSGLFVFFLAAWSFVPWHLVFRVPHEVRNEIALVVLVVVTFFCVQFVFRLISTLLTADQRPAAAGYINTAGMVISLLAVYLLAYVSEGSLTYLSIVFGAANLVPVLIASIWLYRSEYRNYAPTFRSIDFSRARDLVSLGVKFFLLQATAIAMYSSSNMIIIQLFGPEDVAVYGIAFKYFSVVTMLFAIVLTPFWTAFTDAFHRGDTLWIRRSMRRLVQGWMGMLLLAAAMIAASSLIYSVWIGDTLSIPFALTVSMACYVCVNVWNSIFSSFQNGLGMLRIQIIGAVFGGITIIPLAILLSTNAGLGIMGVVWATIIASVPSAVAGPIQYRMVIRGTAVGIWAK